MGDNPKLRVNNMPGMDCKETVYYRCAPFVSNGGIKIPTLRLRARLADHRIYIADQVRKGMTVPENKRPRHAG